jgi:D-glycero-D-manno-heptose 1,7-bisphosphate phosphatase
MLNKAILLDRDGVINEMVYVKEHGLVDSPSNVKQFRIIKGVIKAIKIAKKLGYKVIIISNQPGIAKGYYDQKTFDVIRKKMRKDFFRSDLIIDDEFYCLHHPHAKLIRYRKKCSCRKPGIGLIKKASKTHNLDLKNSYLIGDGICDIQAAKKAGCKSIFVGNISSTITELFDKKRVWPDHVARDLKDAIDYIASS